MAVLLGVNGDSSTVDQLITYGVPGLIALLGVAVGRFWERRSGMQSWRRDRRLDAYTGFLNVLNDLRQHSVRLSTLEDPHAFESERSRMRDAAGRLALIVGQISLLGPSRVEETANEAVKAFRAVAYDLEEWELPPDHGDDDRQEEARRLIREAVKTERAFQKAAQSALN